MSHTLFCGKEIAMGRTIRLMRTGDASALTITVLSEGSFTRGFTIGSKTRTSRDILHNNSCLQTREEKKKQNNTNLNVA